jgi:hypothetical protein
MASIVGTLLILSPRRTEIFFVKLSATIVLRFRDPGGRPLGLRRSPGFMRVSLGGRL